MAATARSEDKLSYSIRKDRCEGVLPRYVGYGDSIELVGYGAGEINMATTVVEVAVAEAASRTGPLTLRALSLTSRKRYQMDRPVSGEGKYRWSLELLRQAQQTPSIQLDPSTLGIVACTNRCANRPDTIYFPVLLGDAGSGVKPALTLKLRADVYAMNVRASLRPASGSAVVEPALGRLELYPDELASISLPPELQRGEYRLEVRATNSETRQQMTSLLARIIVP